MTDDIYKLPAWKKLEAPPSLQKEEVLCCWSDLLGFGSAVSQDNWTLPEQITSEIYTRLSKAQLCFGLNIDPMIEIGLTLNDGFVRSCNTSHFTTADRPSMWFRGCINSHLCLNEADKKSGLPGSRTVICHGQSLIHSCAELKFDDFVFPYTRKDPNKISKVAESIGNPQVYFNPKHFQMNTAFSKAYIIDSAGSKAGVSGPNIFIDQGFIDFLKGFYKQFVIPEDIVEEISGDTYKIAFKSTPKRYYFGLELDNPSISFETGNLRTKVWRVKAFYPWDEDFNEFKYEF